MGEKEKQQQQRPLMEVTQNTLMLNDNQVFRLKTQREIKWQKHKNHIEDIGHVAVPDFRGIMEGSVLTLQDVTLAKLKSIQDNIQMRVVQVLNFLQGLR